MKKNNVEGQSGKIIKLVYLTISIKENGSKIGLKIHQIKLEIHQTGHSYPYEREIINKKKN